MEAAYVVLDLDLYCYIILLTIFNLFYLETCKWVIVKQCRPRSDAT